MVSAGLVGLLSSGSFAISSVFVSPQVKHVNVFTPVDVVVGAVVTSPSFHLCPVAFSVISSFVSSQVEQVYTVFPSFVQVAGVTFVLISICYISAQVLNAYVTAVWSDTISMRKATPIM